MKIVYRAANILEAHIVAGMLEASGIKAHVGGYYLQGAIGELSPLGFASVSVAEKDVDVAAPVIQEYEQALSMLPDTQVGESGKEMPADGTGPVGAIGC